MGWLKGLMEMLTDYDVGTPLSLHDRDVEVHSDKGTASYRGSSGKRVTSPIVEISDRSTVVLDDVDGLLRLHHDS